MGNGRKTALLSLLAVTLLSACLSKGETPQEVPASTIEVPSVFPFDPATVRPKLVDCWAGSIALRVPAADVVPRLPPGYKYESLTSGAIVWLDVGLSVCKSIVVDNETVIPEAAIVDVRTPVEVNKTLGKGADLNSYLFESFATDERLVGLFNDAGIPSTLATIRVEGAPPSTRVSVLVDGKLWYEATILVGTMTGGQNSGVFRYHNLSEGIRPSWVDYEISYAFSVDPVYAVIKTYDGFLSTVGTGKQGVHHGQSGFSGTHGIFSFGHV